MSRRFTIKDVERHMQKNMPYPPKNAKAEKWPDKTVIVNHWNLTDYDNRKDCEDRPFMVDGIKKALKAPKRRQPVRTRNHTANNAERMRSSKERAIFAIIDRYGYPQPICGYRFAPSRRWLIDFAWPERMVALEYEGGTWTGGRHTRGVGYSNDCRKYNAAIAAGWEVYRITADMLAAGELDGILGKIFNKERG